MAKTNGKDGGRAASGEVTKKAGAKASGGKGEAGAAKQAVAKKTPAKKPAARKVAAAAGSRPVVSAQERRRLIAEAAYYRALDRGFGGGDPNDDWLAAEREVDLRYAIGHDVECDAVSDRPPGIEEA